LAELYRWVFVPAIWLPDPTISAERAGFRLHLVKRCSRLKHCIHAALLTHGVRYPVSDLFWVRERPVLGSRDIPAPWRGHTKTAATLIDELTRHIGGLEQESYTSRVLTIGMSHCW
jgi:hypothetical protein